MAKKTTEKLYGLTESDRRRLSDTLRWSEREMNRKKIHRRRSGLMGGGGGFRLAKTQEAGDRTDGKISVKFLDTEGEIIGDAFDVEAIPTGEAGDLTLYFPAITSDEVVVIKRVASEWCLDFPSLFYTDKW